MSKQQTAVDWYFDKIKSHFEHDGDLFETHLFTYSLAKRKEEKQHLKTFQAGQNSTEQGGKCFDQYYSETYITESQ